MPWAPIAAQRLVIGDALGKQQSLDAIDVLDPLGDQHFALAAEATPIFFLWRRPSRTPEVRRAYTPVTREAGPRRRSCLSWRAAVGATSRSTTDRRHGFRRLHFPAPDETRNPHDPLLTDNDPKI